MAASIHFVALEQVVVEGVVVAEVGDVVAKAVVVVGVVVVDVVAAVAEVGDVVGKAAVVAEVGDVVVEAAEVVVEAVVEVVVLEALLLAWGRVGMTMVCILDEVVHLVWVVDIHCVELRVLVWLDKCLVANIRVVVSLLADVAKTIVVLV